MNRPFRFRVRRATTIVSGIRTVPVLGVAGATPAGDGARPPAQVVSVSALQARIFVLSQHVGLTPGNEAAYVRGIARRRYGAESLAELGPEQLGGIEAILTRRLRGGHPPAAWREIEREAEEHAARIGEVMTKRGRRGWR